jgi:DNA replication and repair protein RecF
MSVRTLAVANFRNLASVEIAPAAGINIIFGANAAGKTSLLEALYFLARVRSFRGTRPEQLIRHGAQALLVRGEVESGGRIVRAAVQREGKHTRVKIDGEEVRSLSALARHFPVQVINSESQRLLLDGPRVRRSFLNWTMFHVEHRYYEVWRRYDRSVRQRNAALRSRDVRTARAWEPELLEAAAVLDQMRERLVGSLRQQLAPMLDAWLPEYSIELSYRRGWPQDRELPATLEANRERELEAGHCLFGPHRADVTVRAGQLDAQHALSRGQQKVLVIAILLAQAYVLAQGAEQVPILLVDDLPAELDAQRRAAVLERLQDARLQSLITCVDREALALSAPAAKWFHVEHGAYREVV